MSDSLKGIYLFQNLTEQERQKIAELGTEKAWSAGQDVFISGQKAESFYLVKHGSIKIYSTSQKGDDIQLIQFGTGSHFGEIPFLDQQVRSATASPIETTTLIEIKYAKFKSLLDNDPQLAAKVYFNFAKNLSIRLRNTTENLQQAKEQRLRSA
jgi:CRP/FNR family cyclic AMP-dependent transcriptional regulator